MTEVEAKRARSNAIDHGDADTGPDHSRGVWRREARTNSWAYGCCSCFWLGFALTGYSGCWTGRTALHVHQMTIYEMLND